MTLDKIIDIYMVLVDFKNEKDCFMSIGEINERNAKFDALNTLVNYFEWIIHRSHREGSHIRTLTHYGKPLTWSSSENRFVIESKSVDSTAIKI